MSPPPPEIEVELAVEDGVSAAWDRERIVALVRSIVAREVADGSLAGPVLSEDRTNPAEHVSRAVPDSAEDRTTPVENFSLTGLVPGDVATRRAAPADRYVIALHLVSDASIQALNAEHRSLDARTDVLSFPIHGDGFVTPPGEPINLGDVVVSYPRAVDQADEYGHSVEREIAYLVAHGALHILGYDHEIDADKTRMRQREEAALEPLGYTRTA